MAHIAPTIANKTSMPVRSDEYDDEESENLSSNGIRSQKSSFCCLDPENCNWNTIITLCFVGSNSITFSLWGNPLLPSFIFLATSDESKVGSAEAVQGVTQVFAALIGGFLADKFTRSLVLKAAAIIQLLAGALTILAIFWDILMVEPMRQSYNVSTDAPIHPFSATSVNFLERRCNNVSVGPAHTHDVPSAIQQAESSQWYLILAACAMWGLYAGAYGPALAAIFADSVITGKRSKIYTWREMLKNICRGIGPLISLFAFLTLGNHWELHILGIIMTGGIALTFVPSFFLCLLRDSKSLDDTSRSVLEIEKQLSTKQIESAASQAPEPDVHRPLLDPASEGFDEDGRQRSKHRASVPSQEERALQLDRTVCGCISSKHVPPVLLVSNIISALGSGMTVKFFPIFFQTKVCLAPVSVQAVYVFTPVTMFFAMYVSRKFSKCVGRLAAVQVERTLGLGCLLVMAIFPSVWKLPYVVVPLYIVRTLLTSVGWPLIMSVLNDYVSKEHRSKWNSLQNIAALGWSGSAYVGGIIIDQYGFNIVFYCTAALQALSILIRFLIIPLVPRSEERLRSPRSSPQTKS